MYNINQIADYVIFRLCSEEEHGLVNLKLQKLLYYIQAWHWALHEKPLFDGKFQAWIHGPVNRDIYERFRETKYLYSPITISDIKDIKSIDSIDSLAQAHIANVLEVYAGFSGVDLEMMTHQEDPWIISRKGIAPTERCENEIDETIMKNYFQKRLANN